jgi:hypothetical protein
MTANRHVIARHSGFEPHQPKGLIPMQATMIRIEPGVKMTKAIERCRKAHPRIRRASADTVTVITSSSTHAVKILTPRPGLLLASCDCQAGISRPVKIK